MQNTRYHAALFEKPIAELLSPFHPRHHPAPHGWMLTTHPSHATYQDLFLRHSGPHFGLTVIGSLLVTLHWAKTPITLSTVIDAIIGALLGGSALLAFDFWRFSRLRRKWRQESGWTMGPCTRFLDELARLREAAYAEIDCVTEGRDRERLELSCSLRKYLGDVHSLGYLHIRPVDNESEHPEDETLKLQRLELKRKIETMARAHNLQIN